MFEIDVIYNEADSLSSSIVSERIPITFSNKIEAEKAFNIILEHYEMKLDLNSWSNKTISREETLKKYSNKEWFFNGGIDSYYSEETQLIIGTQLIYCYWAGYFNNLISLKLLDITKKILILKQKDF